MFAMPVAMLSFEVAESSSVAVTKGSRPRVSGIHNVGNPSSSILAAMRCASADGTASSTPVQMPTRPSWKVEVAIRATLLPHFAALDRLRAVRFATELTVSGPWRAPAQMLAEQEVDGHASVHDADSAAGLGLAGAPIEGPTHFSQLDPLAVALWGDAWFERGCISSHFRTMVVEGERVQTSMTSTSATAADIEAHKEDGTPVLIGTASVGPDHPQSALEARLAAQGEPGELFVIDQLEVGMRRDGGTVSMTRDERNGSGYPFSLAEKLERITEPHPWYT